MSYRLLQGAEDDIDRVLLKGARDWGLEAAGRYHRLMLAVFGALDVNPARHGSREVAGVAGVRSYPLRLGSNLVDPSRRVGRPRHIVVYRIAGDGTTEIIGIAHDRMLLPRAARQMQQGSDG